MQTISGNLAQLQSMFSGIDDELDRYSLLIELSSLLPGSDGLRDEQNLYRGCQSQVWLRAEAPDGLCRLVGDSDTVLIRGVLFLFAALIENVPVADVLEADCDLLDALSLGSLFSSQRTLGISGLLPEIRRQLAAQGGGAHA